MDLGSLALICAEKLVVDPSTDAVMSIRSLSRLSWRQLGTGVSAAIVASGTGIALCAEDKKGSVFDSEALERAAKAVKEINASPHAKKVKCDFCKDDLRHLCVPSVQLE